MAKRPYRGYVLVGAPDADKLSRVIKQSKPALYAPASQWVNGAGRHARAYRDRPTLMTLDGFRQAHFLLRYAAHKGYRWEGERWDRERRECLAWLEMYITEMLQARPESGGD